MSTKTEPKNKGWHRSDGPEAHLPNFPITCVNCQEPMVLRYSSVVLVYTENTPDSFVNKMNWKCEHCAWINSFEVAEYADYLNEVIKRRKGAAKYVPSTDQWADASEKMRRQLEALGYISGREIEEDDNG